MAEPIALVAKIKISPEKYQQYIKKVAAEPVANYVAEVLFTGLRDFVIFKYLKNESAIFCFICQDTKDTSALLKGPIFTAIQKIQPFLDETSEGYILVISNALITKPAVLCYSAVIEGQKITEQELGKTWRDQYDKDASKYFFPAVENDFASAYSKQLDPLITRQSKSLFNEIQLESIKTAARSASPDQPVKIFEEGFYNGYFYDGRNFYYLKHSCKPNPLPGNPLHFDDVFEKIIFDDVDIKSLQKTDYGIADAKSIFVGELRIFTNPKTFKRHRKDETIYYSDDQYVYDEKLNLYKDSDGKTFKLKDSYIGEDKDFIYFAGVQLAKRDIGSYQLYLEGFYHVNILLYSQQLVRSREKIFDQLDPPTFTIVTPCEEIFSKYQLPKPTSLVGDCFILHCRDKHGEFIIHNYDVRSTHVEFERIDNLDNYIKQVRPILSGIKKDYLRGPLLSSLESARSFLKETEENRRDIDLERIKAKIRELEQKLEALENTDF